jgi:DNA-binding PadR family transcriptional regulator
MSRSKPKRAQRQPPGGRQLTPRDLLALKFIAEAQPVTRAQLERYLSMSQAMMYRRLRALRDLGMVQVHVQGMEYPNYYTLTQKGQQEVARAFGLDPETVRTLRGIRRMNLAHHGGQVDLYVSLQLACVRVKPPIDLTLFEFEGDIRRRLGDVVKDALIPDAVAVLESASGYRVAVAIEVDCGTESPSWFTAMKAKRYDELRAQGLPLRGVDHWTVACVTPSARRRNTLLKAMWEAKLSCGSVWVVSAEDIDDRTVLLNRWMTQPKPGGENVWYQGCPFDPVQTGGRLDGSNQGDAEGSNDRSNQVLSGGSNSRFDPSARVVLTGKGQ